MKHLLLLVLVVFSQSIFANGNHYHPKKFLKCAAECNEAEVRKSVPEALDILVKAREVKEAWKTVPVEKVEKKKFSKGEEWVVSFFNKNEKNTSKQRLYMFITMDGWLNGANNTGN